VLTRLRLVAGGTALSAGLCLLAASAPAAPPDLPKDSYKKAIAADTASIQKLLNGGTPDKRASNTIRAEAMMLALYGEATGNAALTSQALQVAEAAAKKDWKGADAAAKGLAAPKAGAAPRGPLHEQAKFDLDTAMSPFRLGKVGGLNIEADIRAVAKGGKITGPDAELLAVRTAAIGAYAAHYPNDKGMMPANKGKWDKLSKEMVDVSKQIAEEAKGGANQQKLAGLFKRLDANCTNCHNEFRD
jgi:hypothetical protein